MNRPYTVSTKKRNRKKNRKKIGRNRNGNMKHEGSFPDRFRGYHNVYRNSSQLFPFSTCIPIQSPNSLSARPNNPANPKSNSNPPLIFGPLFHTYESLSSYFSLLFHNKLQQTSHTNSYISNSLILYSYKLTTMNIISNYHFIFA